ncbi:uncharacterized protein ALTATR162_LOCUS10637 [Alternaria atra]|uniref:Uncharacterized protein n=1 Tax=Alternaria atra TaxID=119953 RepID=A0A8J2IA02_9PLEO|nr:uncharacterized protein ALTATR162_LOCUS8108 [Alternaria atra]XP_043174210.1 uncharacterized protein ALTATR162_LOCUS10637 [Alternaria atra]CAG5175452.1 unnamed protein product [Alternaria atra]CAG5183551.1 unnamed protein product [Alternaria atra]
MPVLKLAPQRQSRMTAQPSVRSSQLSARFYRVLEGSTTVVRRWTPTAAAVEETGPVSPTLQRPSNEVIGGAFVGAFLGLLILLLLIWCCCCRSGRSRSSRSGSDKSSSTQSPPSSPRAPFPIPQQPLVETRPPPDTRGPGPVAPLPIRPAPRPASTQAPSAIQPAVPQVGRQAAPAQHNQTNYPGPQAPQPTYQFVEPQAAPQGHSQTPHETSRHSKPTRKPTAFATVHDGKHALGLRRSRGPERPGRHDRVELDSESSSSGGHRERHSHRTQGIPAFLYMKV